MTIDLKTLKNRQDTYLTGHYVGLHVTIVSVALGVGVVAAGSLLSTPTQAQSDLQPFRPTFALLLAASFLAIVVAYGGPLHGVIFLPAGIPGIIDLHLPLILGLTEFGLFTSLAYGVNQWTTARTILGTWWIVMSAFGLSGCAQMLRAHYLIRHGHFSSDAEALRETYLCHLKSQLVGAAITSTLSAIWALLVIFRFERFEIYAQYIAGGVILGSFVGALVGHGQTGGTIRAGLQETAP